MQAQAVCLLGGGGTYEVNGLTNNLPAPAYEANVSGQHVAVYFIANSYPPGTIFNVKLIGILQGPTSLTNTLERVAAFENSFFALAAGASNPAPNGSTRYTCNSQPLEFYVREPNPSFKVGPNVYHALPCTGAGIGYGINDVKYLGIRGNENGSDWSTFSVPDYDYFPGELRPLLRLDSIRAVVTNVEYTGGGTLTVGGNYNEAGFPASGVVTVSAGTPSISKVGSVTTITWYNDGSWPLADDGSIGGYAMNVNIGGSCKGGYAYLNLSYFGKKNPASDAGCVTNVVHSFTQPFDFDIFELNTYNLSGTLPGDESIKCFDIRVDVGRFIGENLYLTIPNSGPNSNYNLVSFKFGGTSYPIVNFNGGQYVRLGTLGGYAQYVNRTYQACFQYSTCANFNVPYFVSWSCSSAGPFNPSGFDCTGVSANLIIQPDPAGIQSQLLTQPPNPITLCDTLKYTVQYTSTLQGNVINGKYTVNLADGMRIAKARIRYPSNAATAQTITPSATTGIVTIPLSLHSGLANGLKGIRQAGLVNENRQAILELDFITDCNFKSGQSFTLNATGDEACGSPALNNGIINITDPTSVSGASQEYFSIFTNLNVGADSIITCETQTVTAGLTIFDEPSVPGGTSLQPGTDSLEISIPSGISYEPGSYSCTGPNCFLSPVVRGNKLIFAVPPGGINIPAGQSVAINFTFGINALGKDVCAIPGVLSLQTIRTVSGISCSTAPMNLCPGVGIVTGGTARTIVANKASLNGFTSANLYKFSNNNYEYKNGSFSLAASPLSAGQSLQMEVFCRTGGVSNATPLHSQTFAGPIATNTPVNFNGFFTGACVSDTLVFRLAPNTANNTGQCICGAKEFSVHAVSPLGKRDTTICEGKTVNLSTLTLNLSGDVITYHSTKPDAEAGTNPISMNVTPLVNTKYYIRNTNSASAYAIDSILVSVNPSPDIMPRDTSICLGSSVNLATQFTTNATLGSVAYYATYIQAVNQVAALLNLTVTPNATTRYYVRKQTSLGCFEIDSIQVSINPLPLADTKDTAICIGGSANLASLVVPNGVPAVLSFHATRADANAGVMPISTMVNPIASTSYFTRRFDAVHGCVNVDSIVVIVNPVPNVTGRDTTACLNAGGTATINLANSFSSDPIPGFISYFTSLAAAQSNTGPLPSGIVNIMAPATYFVRKTSPLGLACYSTSSMNISTAIAPLIDARDTTVCGGNSVTLTSLVSSLNATAGTLSYYVSIADANSQTNALSSTTVSPASTKKYYVRKQAASVCFDIDSISVNVTPKPNAGVDRVAVCIGSASTLTATPTTGTWTALAGNPSGAMVGTTNLGTTSVTFSPSSVGTFNFVYSAAGCTDTTSLEVSGGFDYNDLPALWPVVKTRILSCTDGSGVPSGVTGAVWAGTGVSAESGPYNGVGLDPLDDGITGPKYVVAGVGKNFTVTMNSNTTGKTVYYGLWFDWNNNGNFADDIDLNGNPAFYSGSGVTASPVTRTFVVTPPASISPTYKTRLIVADVPIAANGYVGTYDNGEVEDYETLFIVPVKLKNFNAVIQNCQIKMDWASATEEGLQYYDVQQSEDGIVFNSIARVNGKGSASAYAYSAAAQNGANYLRLKMVDRNGQIEYSRTVNLFSTCSDRTVILYPNPVSDLININLSGYKNKVTAQLHNAQGMLVFTMGLQNGNNTLPVGKFASGFYNITITDADGHTETRKINIIKK